MNVNIDDGSDKPVPGKILPLDSFAERVREFSNEALAHACGLYFSTNAPDLARHQAILSEECRKRGQFDLIETAEALRDSYVNAWREIS